MQPLIPYLVFPGTCRQAMEFYAAVLEGEITLMQTVADSPLDAPAESSDRIFNSELTAGELVIKASDSQPWDDLTAGTNVSLFLVLDNRERRDAIFEQLAVGGRALFPPEGEFSMLRDRYGIQWMLVCEAPG